MFHLTVWDPRTGAEKASLKGSEGQVAGLAVGPGARHLVTSQLRLTDGRTQERWVTGWESSSGKRLFQQKEDTLPESKLMGWP